MDNNSNHKMKLKISGLHCASCEVLVERQFKTVAGVEKVYVSQAAGKAVVYYSDRPAVDELQASIKAAGYAITALNGQSLAATDPISNDSEKNYFQVGAIFLIVAGIYLLAKKFNLLPAGFGVAEGMSYGFVFLIGLVASVSTCMAVTGGLLLASAAKYSELHPDLSAGQKIKPLLYFNGGRLAGYTFFGGLVGGLGGLITFSPRVNGIITILASLAMVFLGLQLLHLFPGLRRLQVKPPKFISHKIHDLSDSNSKVAPAILGALTFFLPCGFTQALQLYVLAHGGIVSGALTMFFFALGTIPALISVSALSSVLRGKPLSLLLKFAGVIAVMLGIFNIQNGLVLAGASWPSFKARTVVQTPTSVDPNVQIVNGWQIIKMKVDGVNYLPSHFTVQKGIPVSWQIDGTQAAGCMSSLIAPQLGIRDYLPRTGIKTIAFTPTTAGTFKFNCPMGMGTPGAAITVIDAPTQGGSSSCDPAVANCLN
ncbi:MAG: sulfite exporter TauE/SafE family protein [Patescibacteria group bacterium]|nr:sulfite exporter TauE/SafE family protein [Patescibacteria group bacterium]